MSGIRHGGHTPMCEPTQTALSEYLEGGLTVPARERVSVHLAECADCRAESAQLASLLRCFRESVPPREPSLDIWAELNPKVQAVLAEQKLDVLTRLRHRASRFLGSVAAGAILFTHALAMHTEARMRQYLTHDPFRLAEDEF